MVLDFDKFIEKTSIPFMIIALGLLAVSFLPIGFNAYAEPTVTILEGNTDPSCINTKCHDPEELVVNVGTKVKFINKDIPAHTIVSGSPYLGSDGTFDSGLILPEKTWEYTFNSVGDWPYYCVLHPWATGIVRVVGSGEQIPEIPVPQANTTEPTKELVKQIGNIGSKVGDGTSLTMEYVSKGDISGSSVNIDDKSVSFMFEKPAPAGDEVIMKIRAEIVTDPTMVYINNDKQLETFRFTKQNEFNILAFQAPVDTFVVTVYGSQVIPEFPNQLFLLIGIAIIFTIIITRRKPSLISKVT